MFISASHPVGQSNFQTAISALAQLNHELQSDAFGDPVRTLIR